MDRIFPVTLGHISSGYGKRSLMGCFQNHGGIDIVSDSPDFRVFCPITGIVVEAGYSKSFGNRVYIKVREGEYYVLAHLSSIAASCLVGKRMLKGSLIGVMGNSGYSLGRHLHWGFYRDYKDPKSFYFSNALIF